MDKQLLSKLSFSLGFPSAEVVSAKFNFKSFRLTIRWSNNFTAVARLIDQEEACKFSGRFVLDPASEVLVTGCTPEDDLTIQFHSKQFGNQLFTAGKDGRVVQYEPEDDMDYQHFTIESEYTPQVIPGSNGRVRRDADYDYDFVILSDDLALLPDLGEYEVEDEAVPTKVDLQLSFYLDPAFIKLHGSKADTIARQIVEQTRLLMKHSSLNTKIELIDGNRFYNSETHLAFSNQSVASKDIMITLKELLQSPFDIGKHPVAHVYITVPDGKFVKGVAIAGAMCHPKKSRQGRPRAIITWQKDVARTASTMAHEVGHLLGMYHDWNTRKDRTKNKCGVSGDGVFILNYGNPRTVWSSCSNDDFKTYYLKHMFQDEEFCLKTTGINSSTGEYKYPFYPLTIAKPILSPTRLFHLPIPVPHWGVYSNIPEV